MVGTLGPGVGYGRAARFMYVATAGQVTFSGADASTSALTLQYTPGYVEVAVNGIWQPPTDYTATNGSSIVLPSGCTAGDIVYAYVLSTFTALLNPFPMPGSLWGLTMSTAGSSATLSVAKGSAADSTNTTMMALSATMAKTTSAWVSGTAAGGLDTGSVAVSTWYHWFLIYNPITAVTDVLFSLSATTPTLPAGFTLFRRIGSMKTNGSSQWTKFVQYGDKFLWDTPTLDANGSALSTTSISFTLSTPLGVKCEPIVQLWANRSSAQPILFARSGDVADITPSAGAANTFTDFSLVTAGASSKFVDTRNLMTGLSSEIFVRADAASTNLNIGTWGWIDTRGRNA